MTLSYLQQKLETVKKERDALHQQVNELKLKYEEAEKKTEETGEGMLLWMNRAKEAEAALERLRKQESVVYQVDINGVMSSVTDDLGMLILRLVHALKKYYPDNELVKSASEYMTRIGY